MLAILAPEEKSVKDLLKKVSTVIEDAPIGTNIYKASYENHDFIIMTTGYGKVNIGRSLEYLKYFYHIKAVMQIGTAGSIYDSCNILSAVITTSTLQFDVHFMPLGYGPGILPGVKTGVFSADEDLICCMKKACNMTNVNYFSELMATSDMFVCNNALANSIRREYNAGAVDCECGGVGEYCYLNGIAFVGVKIISNFAYNNALKQYQLYDDTACLISQKIAYNFIKNYYH